MTQLIGVAAGWALAIVGTYALLKLVALVTPLRATEEDEILGLDLSQHGEAAYGQLTSGLAASAAPEAAPAFAAGAVGSTALSKG